jgi:preprotein translocase subunit SecY
MYLDEVVSKYGIGSGIGLFIAGGVSFELFWKAFNPFTQDMGLSLLGGSGVVYRLIAEAGINMYSAINLYLLPIIFTIVVFLVVVFAEGIHVNIPITMGHKGTGGRYPVKFLYVSNIPVIFAVAVFANFMAVAKLVEGLPVIGLLFGRLGSIMAPPYNLREDLLAQLPYTSIFTVMADSVKGVLMFFNPFQPLSPFAAGGETIGFAIIHALLYLVILTLTCVVFGKFWVEMGNQGPVAIANQLQKAGMSIPGFRRDPRIMTKVLERYIPYVTVLGSAFVAILAGFADLTGALASGMGILLTVGIIYRLYEELARLQVMEMHPLLGKMLG